MEGIYTVDRVRNKGGVGCRGGVWRIVVDNTIIVCSSWRILPVCFVLFSE